MATYIFYTLLIIGPLLIAAVCFVGLPVLYALFAKRVIAARGFDQAGNIFGGITIAAAIAAYLEPPKIVREPVGGISDVAATIRAKVQGAEPLAVEWVIDWPQTLLMLVLDPPILLWIVLFGGLGVLYSVSRRPIAHND